MSSRAMARTAYHEAGHAVMSVLRRMPFECVTVESDGQSTGHVAGLGLGSSWSRTDDLALIAYAGSLAEMRFIQGVDDELEAGAAHDMALLADMGVAVENAESTATRANRVLDENWAHVERLASALLMRRRMSARSVRRLLRSE